jgi:hypothetical protein
MKSCKTEESFTGSMPIYMCVCVCVCVHARVYALGFFIVRNEYNFQTSFYTVLMQGVKTICTDQLPTFHVFSKSIFCAGIRIFISLPCSLTGLKNGNAQSKVSFRRYLNTHTFYPVDEFFYVSRHPYYCI